MSTPSYAARWFLPICLVLVGWWAWGHASGHTVVWAALTVMVATPALSLGWYLISLISPRYEPLYILDKAERAHKNRIERKRAEDAAQHP